MNFDSFAGEGITDLKIGSHLSFVSYKNGNVSSKGELPALLPIFFKKEEHWTEDGCK